MSLTNLLLNMCPLHVGHRIALTLILSLIAVAPSMAAKGNISGSGSDTDPYLIEDVADWNAFATKVNAEGSMMSSSYQGKFIKLCTNIGTEDAPVTNKIGKWFMSMNLSDPSLSPNKPFSGTFDGGGHTITVSIGDEEGVGTALFSYIKGATIKNLTVKGTVSGKNHVAGLVGISEGSGNRIENCVVSTTVNGGTHIGGILGHGLTSDISIDNCVFRGMLVGGSKARGVFFGWGDDGGTKTVSNCLYIQQDGQSTVNLDLVKMNAGSVAVTDCYKTAEVGTYGALVYLKAPTDAITEEKVATDGTPFYIILKTSISGSGTKESPYIISKASQWDEFADLVSQGYTFVGKFFKLNENISVTKKVGVVKSDGTLASPFSGTFDGGGFTITASIEDEDNPGTALFSYISGATIKNLTLAGSVTGGIHAAGLVGFSKGTGNKIENCVVSATINGGSHIGGILGHGLSSDISIDNCVFKGELVGGETAKGIFVGWGDDGRSKTISNCLYIQQNGQKTDNLDLARKSNGSVNVTGGYKTANVGTYGEFVYLSAPTDANMITEEKTAADGTMFYVVTGFATGEVPVTSATTEMTTGSYRVFNDVTVGDRIKINGDVKLVLDEGKTLNATKGIEVSGINKLTIDGKGTLNASGYSLNSLDGYAGIGGGVETNCGNIVVNDGIINATGGSSAAGIGGGSFSIVFSEDYDGTEAVNGSITINGGVVTATGGDFGAGIGGGSHSGIKSIVVNDGLINATGKMASGIGGQTEDYRCEKIDIKGGKIFAYGKEYWGDGIGLSSVVNLGWTNQDDCIYADSYSSISPVYFGKETLNLVDVFTYTENGELFLATTDNINGKTLLPVARNNLKISTISGIKPRYLYTGNVIEVAYDVFDIDGNKLKKGIDYTETFSHFPIKNADEYTLTIDAVNGGKYVGSKSVSFSVVKFDLGDAIVNGVQAYYLYTEKNIAVHYEVTGFEGKMLTEGVDFKAEFDRYPVKDKGDYALTITALNSNVGYTGAKTIRFNVFTEKDGSPVTSETNEMNALHRVTNDVSVDTRIVIKGDVVLILDEGKTLNATKGIELSRGNKLTIMGSGMLIATGDDDNSGIGAYDVGTLVVNGGVINATGGKDGAGIGGSIHNINGGTITINGGIVTAIGGNQASGIGGGFNNWVGDYGVCGLISVNGGKVTANGGQGASGIGPGENAPVSGSVTLGWTDEDDFIYAGSYGNVSSISFVDGVHFYWIENGEKSVATVENIGGKKIHPVTSTESLKNIEYFTVSVKPYYHLSTENDVSVAYEVTGFDGYKLIKGLDFEESFSPFPVNASGEYTLTITGIGSYVGRKSLKFIVAEYFPVTTSTTIMEDYGIPYRVIDDVTVDARIIVNGNVTLVLDEGKTLNASHGIDLYRTNKLTIEGSGTLNATGYFNPSNGDNKPGIGSDEFGTLVINGGIINATGKTWSAGIGGSDGNIAGGTIIINGGKVTARGGQGAAGIGGGWSGVCGVVAINGGKVTARGGSKIDKSDVDSAAGIGPGQWFDSFGEQKPSGTVILGWTNKDDYVFASSYDNIENINFAKGKSFYYTNSDDEIIIATKNNINSKVLYPLDRLGGQFNINVSGVEPTYNYTGNNVLSYKVTDLVGGNLAASNYSVTLLKDGEEVSSAINTGDYSLVVLGKGVYEDAVAIPFSIAPKISNYAAVQVLKDEKGTRAVIDGEYDGADAVAIDQDIDVESVIFNRVFTPNSGFATIMFPFDINATKLTGVRSVIEFDGVKTDKNGNNRVGMVYVWCNATLGEQELEKGHPDCNKYSGELKAYTPYMVEMETPTLGINGNVTLKSNSGKIVGDAPEGNWVFRGTLQKKEWSGDENIIKNGRIWAFAGSARNGASIGKFVQFGGNNWANPFRAYLVECKDTGNGLDCSDEDSETQPKPSLVSRYRFADALAPTNSAEKSAGAAATDQSLVMRGVAASETALLNSMDIVIVYGDKDSESGKERSTVIGRMNPTTGEIRMLPRTKQTYDLKGRKVGKGKKAKGAYYRK